MYTYDKDNIFVHGLQAAKCKPLDVVTQRRTATGIAPVYGTDTTLPGHSALSPAVLTAAVSRASIPEECVHVPSCTDLSVWYKTCLQLPVH